jgi:SWI/SNF-related matrix-associated actin-dependent regulator 1 of chromatin subfamily A
VKTLTIGLSGGLELSEGQLQSVRDIIHVFEHGAVKGTGTARGALLADEQGCGKTLVTIAVADAMDYQLMLVVVPQALRENWGREIRRWKEGHPQIYQLTAETIGLYPPGYFRDLTAGWVIVNYDILHKCPELKEKVWDLCVCDESIALKTRHARRTAAVFGGAYRKRYYEPISAKKYLMLTGTPMPNRIDEIVTVVEALDPANWSLQGIIKNYYEHGYHIDASGRITGVARNLHILQRRLRETVMVRSLKADVLDLPEKHHERISVPLNDAALAEWFEERMAWRVKLLAMIRDEKKAKLRAELQAKLNAVQARLAHVAGLVPSKIDAVVEYLLPQNEKVVMFARHRDVVAAYVNRLQKAGRGVVFLTGDNSRKAQKLVERFTRDSKIQFFVANMHVGGQGLNLQVANHVVLAELDWSPAVMEQCEDRCHRMGQTRPVKIVYFVLQHSIEEVMVGSMSRKVRMMRVALNPPKPQLVMRNETGE